MARQRKQTVDYFPHMVTSGKTLFIIENTFGNDGYSFWFKLLELIAASDGHSLDCGNPAEWRFLLAKTRLSDQSATEILDMLAELDAIDNELWKQRIIWATNFVDNVADVYKKRKVGKPKKPEIERNGQHKSQTVDQSATDSPENDSLSDRNPQSKVKESKVKESKGKDKETREKNSPVVSPISELINYFQDNIGSVTPTNMTDLEYDLEDFNGELELLKAAIDICARKNKRYYAFFAGILRNWNNEGIRTFAQLKNKQADDDEWKNKKQAQTGSNEVREALGLN